MQTKRSNFIKSLFHKFYQYGFYRFTKYLLIEMKMIFYNHPILKSYSQKGEDLVIDRLLNYKLKGFYIDVGANHPTRLSNTKRFYDKGWTGINIEPSIKQYNLLKSQRPKDININVGIASKPGKMTYFEFVPNTLSTFSKDEAESYMLQGYKKISEHIIPVMTLSEILNKHLPKSTLIDFMSIDTEGFDNEVLMSNDWLKFKPKIICIESVRHRITNVNNQEDYSFVLSKYNYKNVYDNGLNSLYMN